jgi:hypothetical protein
MRFLPVLAASNCDPTPGSHSQKWTPTSCHFVVDVENAVRHVVEKLPDADELIRAWERLQDDDTVIRESETRLIRLLALVFKDRGLEPWQYFTTVRQGGIKRRAA